LKREAIAAHFDTIGLGARMNIARPSSRRRAAACRASARDRDDPEILIGDEPTGNSTP